MGAARAKRCTITMIVGAMADRTDGPISESR
jgi:hypothetical protein